MRTFVQLPPDPGDTARARELREQFHDYVLRTANASLDDVVIVEPNAALAEVLLRVWDDWPSVMWVWACVTELEEETAPKGEVDFWKAEGDGPIYASMMPDRHAVERRFPTDRVQQVRVPVLRLPELLDQRPDKRSRVTIAVDAGSRAMNLPIVEPMSDVDALILTWGSDATSQGLAARLREEGRRAGLVPAGRAFGPAGVSALQVRTRRAADRLRVAGEQVRVRAGESLVAVRDRGLGPSRRAQVLQPVRVALRGDRSRRDILDRTPGQPIRQPPLRDVEAFIASDPESGRQCGGSPRPTLSAPPRDDPGPIVRECFERHGVWPISFSYPREPRPLQDPGRHVAAITPGIPYSFDDENAYLSSYADAAWGVTHRKAGWDCFRHVEILASGASPLMIDADLIPRFSMTHYPKTAMGELAAGYRRVPGAEPDQGTRQALREYFHQHLSSRAMAGYVLATAGLAELGRVLFVDEVLPQQVDYQSVMTLIGLKQILGARCHVLAPVDYIYEDTTMDTTTLFGRGFGFTRTVPRHLMSTTETDGPKRLSDFDAIIVGSVARNEQRAHDFLGKAPADRTIWIHGEDLPPTVDEVARYRRAGVHIFVRSIHA